MEFARRTLLLGLASVAFAQEQPNFSSEVKVVSLLATVRDKDGRIVKNLTQDDFTLLEDGVPQKIRYFAGETDLPLKVGLLVDTSRSQIEVLEPERRASVTFLDQVLRPDRDQALIASFDAGVKFLQGLTSSREELASALDRLQVPPELATLIFSAVRKSSEDVMKKQEGRKALILLTDGVAYRDPVTIGAAIEFAQRADCILYSIRFSDPIHLYRPIRAAVQTGFREKGRQGLERMARETGGESYEVSKGVTIEAVYSQIEEALRNQYSIGYTPERPDSSGKFHKIKLTTKDSHLVVKTRDGYYAK